jgi:hypothetical protein
MTILGTAPSRRGIRGDEAFDRALDRLRRTVDLERDAMRIRLAHCR